VQETGDLIVLDRLVHIISYYKIKRVWSVFGFASAWSFPGRLPVVLTLSFIHLYRTVQSWLNVSLQTSSFVDTALSEGNVT